MEAFCIKLFASITNFWQLWQFILFLVSITIPFLSTTVTRHWGLTTLQEPIHIPYSPLSLFQTFSFTTTTATSIKKPVKNTSGEMPSQTLPEVDLQSTAEPWDPGQPRNTRWKKAPLSRCQGKKTFSCVRTKDYHQGHWSRTINSYRCWSNSKHLSGFPSVLHITRYPSHLTWVEGSLSRLTSFSIFILEFS